MKVIFLHEVKRLRVLAKITYFENFNLLFQSIRKAIHVLMSKVISMYSYFSELEALEACYWLKAAGFPQYAKVYEGKRIICNFCFVLFQES